MTTREITIALILAVSLCVTGCWSFKKDKTEPTAIQLEIIGSPSMNPDLNARPSPVIVRVYQLGAPGAFESAGFDAIFYDEQSTLASDLIKSEEFVIRPGDIQQYRDEPEPEALYLGVVAAFRGIDSAVWKRHIAIPQHKNTRVRVLLEGVNVEILKD